MTDFGVIDNLVHAMEKAESVRDMTGEAKKKYALELMETIHPDQYKKYDDILPVLIDFVTAVSKNKYVIDLNRKMLARIFSCCRPK